ncbi:hypothetical protein Tco_0943165, partial [Tanacetum coccineum]
NFMPLKPDLSFTSLEEFTNEPVVIKPVVENSEAKASEAKPKVVRKNNGAPIIEDWVSDSEEENVSQTKIEKKTAKPRLILLRIKNGNAAKLKAVVNVARPKAVVNVVKGNNVNDVKASACWVWKPKTKVLDHVSKHNNASITLIREIGNRYSQKDKKTKPKQTKPSMGLEKHRKLKPKAYAS